MRNFLLHLDPWFKRYLRFSSYAIEGLCIAMFTLMLASYVWNIFLRVAFSKGTTWHQEVSVMAAMWVYFAAYSLVSKENSYVRVEFIVDRLLPGLLSRMLDWMIQLGVIAFHIIMLTMILTTFKAVSILRTYLLEWPEYFYYVPLLVGTIDIILTEIIRLIRLVSGAVKFSTETAPTV
jgi:TRAP-type C4-dicarboxylate transport system permease small subunit